MKTETAHFRGGQSVIALLFTVVILTAVPLYALDHSGYITADETWYAADNPHTIVSTVTVNAGVTLTVEAGVEVWANQNTSLTVAGTLVATGTLGVGITFTQVPSQTYDWYGLQFSGSGTGSFTYCTIEEANSGVYATSGPVELTSTTFRNNVRGFYGEGVAPTFVNTGNLFQNNGTGIYLRNIPGLSLTAGGTIWGNKTAGIDLYNCSSATLDNLTFMGNGGQGAIYARLGGAFTVGAGNTIGGSGLENSWPVTIGPDAFPAAGSVVPSSGNTNNAIQVLGGTSSRSGSMG